MSWISNLCDTYDRCAGAAGILLENTAPLLPTAHILMKTNIEILLDKNGDFIKAKEEEAPIIAPCTENSESRSGTAIFPHPLYDQLGYLSSEFGKEKYSAYLEQLNNWRGDNPKLAAVYNYISNDTIVRDIKNDEVKYDEKTGIRFSVEGFDYTPELWLDAAVTRQWQKYYLSEKGAGSLCYVTGNSDSAAASKHPKNINSFAANAKLISGNDNVNFTFRGRFIDAGQAVSLSYAASQKAHQMLKWLISNHGFKCGTQAIILWAIDKKTEVAKPFSNTWDWLEKHNELEKKQSDADLIIEIKGEAVQNYAALLNEALSGFANTEKLLNHERRIAVMATDATTKDTGRLSITFYQEFREREYIDSVIYWHKNHSWFIPYIQIKTVKNGNEYVRKKYIKHHFFGAPSTDDIIETVYGKPRGKKDEKENAGKRDEYNGTEKDEAYNKIKKAARERLLHCIFCGETISRDWVKIAVSRVSDFASSLNEYGDNEKCDFQKLLSIACALVPKSKLLPKDEKGDFKLELDKTQTDRSYLFGRLLAVADKIEQYARQKQNAWTSDPRPTNALRYMSIFSRKPFRTWNRLMSDSIPYYLGMLYKKDKTLKKAEEYWNKIQEITAMLELSEKAKLDDPLNGNYLIGYSLQWLELKTFKNSNVNNEKTEETENELE